jgi:hypothetical protein
VTRNPKLAGHLAEAVEWRLNKAAEAVDGVVAADAVSPDAPLDPVINACDQARRWSVRAESDAEIVSMLIDGHNLDEARELLSGRLTDEVAEAERHAAMAELAASHLVDQFNAAVEAIDQAQSLLSLAAQPTWNLDGWWLHDAVARASSLRCRVAQAEQESDAARELAFMAAAHTVPAQVARGLAQSDLEHAESVLPSARAAVQAG